MSPDEWLGVVSWVNSRLHRPWTLDQAARYGVALRDYEVTRVRGVLDRLIRRGSFELRDVVRELRKKPSKYAGTLERKHRELFPSGCANRQCDICWVDNDPTVRNMMLQGD